MIDSCNINFSLLPQGLIIFLVFSGEIVTMSCSLCRRCTKELETQDQIEDTEFFE